MSVPFPYEIRDSIRAKHLSVVVHPDGRVVVTKPRLMPRMLAERWVAGKQEWIEQMREKFKKAEERAERKHGKRIELPRHRRGSSSYTTAIKQARTLLTTRVQHFAPIGNFSYAKISIRNQKTRWGSCSARGALSFNYRLIYLPPKLMDYVVVHELAHTKHHNHSERFWAEVARILPNYGALRNELQRYRY